MPDSNSLLLEKRLNLSTLSLLSLFYHFYLFFQFWYKFWLDVSLSVENERKFLISLMVVGDRGDAGNLCRSNRGQRWLIKKEWWLITTTTTTEEGRSWWKFVGDSLYSKRFDPFSTFLFLSSFSLLLYFHFDFHSPLIGFLFWFSSPMKFNHLAAITLRSLIVILLHARFKLRSSKKVKPFYSFSSFSLFSFLFFFFFSFDLNFGLMSLCGGEQTELLNITHGGWRLRWC